MKIFTGYALLEVLGMSLLSSTGCLIPWLMALSISKSAMMDQVLTHRWHWYFLLWLWRPLCWHWTYWDKLRWLPYSWQLIDSLSFTCYFVSPLPCIQMLSQGLTIRTWRAFVGRLDQVAILICLPYWELLFMFLCNKNIGTKSLKGNSSSFCPVCLELMLSRLFSSQLTNYYYYFKWHHTGLFLKVFVCVAIAGCLLVWW